MSIDEFGLEDIHHIHVAAFAVAVGQFAHGSAVVEADFVVEFDGALVVSFDPEINAVEVEEVESKIEECDDGVVAEAFAAYVGIEDGELAEFGVATEPGNSVE